MNRKKRAAVLDVNVAAKEQAMKVAMEVEIASFKAMGCAEEAELLSFATWSQERQHQM